jgi:UDP-N-acetylmuramate: L-alanyl-gamma-D-glutamyl-meso-diaminopimelate ligase
MWHYLPFAADRQQRGVRPRDIYRDEEAYRFAFARFINLVPRSGTLVAGWDSPMVRDLAPAAFAPVESFGYTEGGSADGEHPRWTARDVEFGERGRASPPCTTAWSGAWWRRR